MNYVIITRHRGTVKWLAERGFKGKVIAHACPSDICGADVIGNLPLHLAAEAKTITTIDMPLLAPEQRGKDLSPTEMSAAGAKLSTYTVAKIDT